MTFASIIYAHKAKIIDLKSKYLNMKMTKNLGIWMDYSTADLIEFNLESFEIKSIDSGFLNQKKMRFWIKMNS